LDETKISIEHFEKAIEIGSKIFIGIDENPSHKDGDSIL
jgi:hypothetical protein